MKRLSVYIFFVFIGCSKLFAQDNDLQLAKQYVSDGEQQKALDIYQKLYKKDNETYFPVYFSCLLNLKKFDDAINLAKKMIRKHPDDHQYVIQLARLPCLPRNFTRMPILIML